MDWLQGYFLLVGAVGLAVDAVRRWAWVSGLAVGLPVLAGLLLFLGGGGVEALLMAVTALALLAVGIPALRLFPDHAGPTVLDVALIQKGGGRPIFPVLLAWATVGVAVAFVGVAGACAGVGAVAVHPVGGVGDRSWRCGLAARRGCMTCRLLPAAGFVALVALAPEQGTELFWRFRDAAMDLRPPETARLGR